LKTLDDLLASTKKSVVVSAYNCENRPINLISEAIDSGTTFVMLDPFKRDENYIKISNTEDLIK